MNKQIRIQIISKKLPVENRDGSNAYLLDLMRYLRQVECKLEYVGLESIPDKQFPWFVIPFTLKTLGEVQVRNNLLVGCVLLRFNSLLDWFYGLGRLIYYRLPQYTRIIYLSFLIRIIKNIYKFAVKKKQQSSEYQANTKTVNAPDWRDFLAKPEEIAFAKSRIAKFKPDVVLVNYAYLANVLDILSPPENILKVILTHDVFHHRNTHLKKIGIAMYEGDWDRDKESQLLRKAQVLLAIQEEDAKVFKEMTPQCEVIVMPKSGVCHYHATKQVPGRCLFVGSGAQHNYQGLQWFLENVWLQVIELKPDNSLHICGDICNFISGTFPNVHFLGRVDNLEPEYAAAEVCLVPLLAGSGLKIKLVEAMSYGRVCVSTSVGVQGLREIVDRAVLVADSAEDFAAAIHTLLTDIDKRQWMEEQAHKYITEKLSPQAAYQPFVNRIEQHLQEVAKSTTKQSLDNRLSDGRVTATNIATK